MKKTLALLLFLTIGYSTKLLAQDEPPENPDYKFALGVRLSNASPSISNSVTAKYFLNESNALEALISFGSRFGVGLLYEKHRTFGASAFKWFYGFGGYAGFQGGDTYVGPTGIIGFDYKFSEIPLNLSLDWKPELDIIPKVNLVPDAFGFSARYTF